MDPKLAFWTAALMDLAAIVTLVSVGVWSIRRRDVARHRRCMKTAGALVALFIGSYAVKLAVLGREQTSVWSDASIQNLRIHETCVLAMLVGGGIALRRARAMRDSRNVTGDATAAPAPPGVLRWHRRAGWTAVVGAVLGFATAVFVLLGMYERAGLISG